MHPPVVLPQDINRAHPRSAMGLPCSYVAGPADPPVPWAELLPHTAGDAQALAARVEDPRLDLRQRLAAGALLAIVGDPRIRIDAPAMVDLPARDVTIGTAWEAVPSLLDDYCGLAIQRPWIEKECPQHLVRVPAFRLGRYLVTHGEFRQFLQATGVPCLPRSWHLGRYPHEQSNHPVWGVRHAWAMAYCHWLSRETGRHFHLPSEMQWESAAAGVERREFPWGEGFSPDRANTLECGLLGTSAVGAFPAGQTPEGVLDLAGNVEEFVADAYRPYPGGCLVDDDLFQADTAYPMTRGGCFSRWRDLARCRRRHGHFDAPLYACGFRLAETLDA